MNAATIWIIIIGLTLVTIVTRSCFLVLGDRFPLPERVQHALRYAPACALAALIAPELVLEQGTLNLSLTSPRLLAGVAAAAIMLTMRSMLAAMVVGMLAYSALRMVAP
jgi:branched-subunit amino acid transport protein